MVGKHDGLVTKLKAMLDEKPYVTETYKNVNYRMNNSQLLGEVDVLAFQGTGRREVYYEIKSRHTYRNLLHAKEQLVRWTKFMKRQHPMATFYGIYYAPGYIQILAKNGKGRLNADRQH